jgi:hypothetical protein
MNRGSEKGEISPPPPLSDCRLVAVGTVSTTRLLSAEGGHVMKPASHTGSTIGRLRAIAEAVRRWPSGRLNAEG